MAVNRNGSKPNKLGVPTSKSGRRPRKSGFWGFKWLLWILVAFKKATKLEASPSVEPVSKLIKTGGFGI
jgi:hypothetical protein